MSSTSVVYSYNQSLFTHITPTGIDFNDLYTKSHALNYASAVFFDVSSFTNPDSTTTYTFTYNSALNQTDKQSLDAFVTNYVFVPRVDVCAIALEKQPTGIDAGTFTANTWTTRTLSVLNGAQIFATLNNNQITVNPGTYIIVVKGTSVNVGNNRIRINNITDGIFSYGSNTISNSISNTTSDVHQFFNFWVPTTFKIEHICQNTITGFGLGKATGFDLEEIYTRVFIHQTQSY